MLFLKITLTLTLLVPHFCYASFFEDVGKEIASPVTTKAKYYLLGGSLLTGLLTVDGIEDNLGHDVQKDTVEDKPLGKFSKLGDMAGQMIPNAIYVASMYGLYYYTEDLEYKSKSVHMFKSTAYTVLTTTLLKIVIREPRPDSNNRESFPSGHTASAFAFASVIGTEHEWYWGAAAYTMAGFVAWSRINDNAHRLHDVVGGAVIGLSYGLSIHYLYKDENSEIAKVYLAPLHDGLLVGYRTDF
jgi:hypothetical protein